MRVFVLRLFAVVVTVAAVTVGLVAAPASAHTELTTAAPSDGEVVTAAPASVRLEFSGPLAADGDHALGVFGPDGERVDDATMVAVSDRILETGLPGPLPATGEYEVRFLAEAADGHVQEGSYRFAYQGPVATPAPTHTPGGTPSDTPAAVPTPTTSPPQPADDAPAAASGGDEGGNGGAVPLVAAIVVVVGLAGVLVRKRLA